MLASGGNTLNLKGVIGNSGFIALHSGAALGLDPSAQVTLTNAAGSGGGYVQLDDNPYNSIMGVGGAAATLDNVNNTITGSGQFLNVTIVNEAGGTINASGPGNQLAIGGSNKLLNSGLVEATGAAGLNLSGQTIDAKLGGSFSIADGSQIVLASDTFIGGTFNATGTGKWVIDDASNVFDGSVTDEAITNNTTLTANGGNGLTLKGAIHNIGTIAAQQGATLTIDPTTGVTLDGGGKISLDDNPYNYLYGAGSVLASLTNVDNTIAGSGQFLDLTIVNEVGGTINASGATAALVINSSDVLQNSGVMEATGAPGLNISSQTIDLKLGGSFSIADGSQIVIASDTFIGGTFSAAGTGKWVINDASNVLDGSVTGEAITNNTTLTAVGGNTLTLKGAIHNVGTIALQQGATLTIDPTAGVDAGRRRKDLARRQPLQLHLRRRFCPRIANQCQQHHFWVRPVPGYRDRQQGWRHDQCLGRNSRPLHQ